MQIQFTIYGRAVPQGRPRAYRRGNFIGMYDPKESKAWKQEVRWQALQHKSLKLFTGAIIFEVHFWLPKPKSLPKKIVHHTKKPDLDNLVKAIKDALKGIIYRDDSQVVYSIASKGYGEPHIDIAIQELTEDENAKVINPLQQVEPFPMSLQ